MAGYESAFQAIDETIADCCIRELPWEFSANIWRVDPSTNARQRISEVYRIGRPLILKILKMDKSPLKNKKKVSICRSMMTAAQDKMEHHSPYEALTAYNKAVIFAPHVEDHLSRACADRAACLLEIGDPESALKDIEHALAIDDYPFEKLFELEERRGHALLGMKQFGRARESFQKSIARLEDAAGFLHKKMVDRKMGELKAALASATCKMDEVVKDGAASKFINMKKLPELKGKNQNYPALSNKVDVFTNPTHGREIFANSEVPAGDLLGVERPLVSFLEKDYMKSNCWHCLVTLKAPFACPLCSAVKFCSKSCLDEALHTYHPSECLLTDLLVANRISSWVLAYRAVSSRDLKHHLNCRDSGSSGVFASDDLANLLRLNFPRTTHTEEEVKKRTVIAVFYLILLQMTGYFDSKDTLKVNPSLSSIQQMKGKENDASLSEEELYIGLLLDRTIEATPFCTTEVCHFEMSNLGDWTTGKVTPVIGKTINPTLALVSHSCYPTAARVCHQNKTLLVAQKNIKPGERITINYSAPFYAAARAERMQYLQNGYSLRCECDSCLQDWPLFDLLPPGPPGLQPDLDAPPSPVDVLGFRSLTAPSISATNNSHLTKTEQSVIETFNRVKSRIEQLQAVQGSSGPPTKVMIQSQVRLFRCLLAMYSSKLYTLKTGYGSLAIPV
jgi:tetratricopeptide (TPR) repeat protein